MNDKQCRLCLVTDNLNPIFRVLDRCEEYSRVLKLTTGLKITLTDGLPQFICSECTELVNLALSLRNRSQTSEKKLKQAGYKTIDTAPNFSDSEISEYEITDFNWPVIENEDSTKTDSKLEHEHPNLKSDDKEFNSECHTDLKEELKVKKKLEKETKNKPKVEPNLPVSDQVLTELKNEKALAGGKQPETSKKAKRAMYMELVDGVFDPNGPVKCKVCKKTVSKWACFVSHAKLHLGFKFVCEYCGKSFISSTQLNRHCRSWHGMPRQLQCRQCSYLALDKAQLLLHSRREHTGERPFVCDACAARYRSRRCLLQHLESHRASRDVQCPDCGTFVKSRRHLARHRYSAHRRAPR